MKRRITLHGADLWEAIHDNCLSSVTLGKLVINKYESTGLGMSGKFVDMILPEIHIRYSIAHMPFELGIYVDNTEPLVQMHFGLTGYEFSTIGGKPDLHVYSGQHNLFYLPGNQKDFLLHGRHDNYITFEINFSPDYLFRLVADNYSLLQDFYQKIESGDAALLGKSMPISFEMRLIIEQITHCKLPDQLKQLYIEAKVQELFVLQLQQFGGQNSSPVIKLHQSDIDKLTQIKELIDANYTLDHSLDSLSMLFGLNTDKLKKGFKYLFGASVFGYLHQLKMNKSKKLLLNSQLTIAEIATITGYKNPQHFSKAFKDTFGLLPKESRF